MPRKTPIYCLAILLLAPAAAQAERVRYHFVPAANSATLLLQPIYQQGAGERLGLFGGREPYAREMRATQIVTLRHPATNCCINVPIRMPEGTPRIEHAVNRTTFNYGSYVIDVYFLADGSVDVIYDSGPLRPLQ